MPTLSPYLVLNHKGPRVGPRPEGHEAWCVLQDIDTMTFSEALTYELPEQQEASETICRHVRYWLAEEESETQRAVDAVVFRLRSYTTVVAA